MFAYLFFFLIIVFAYLTILHFVFWGLKKLPLKEQSSFPAVSVIIAAHNEAQRITPTLEALEKLDYPKDKYEVIFVDDASADHTADLIERYCTIHDNWQLIRSNRDDGFASGKKHALRQGIARAKGEVIFTTDADCVVPPAWLRYMTAYFEPDVDMVLGYSPLKRFKGFLNTILQFDNLFSVIVASAPSVYGFPLTSVGRNLAYRRVAYQQIGGYDALKNYRSGDDVFLTERFRQKGKGRIVFCAHPQTFVETLPPQNFKQFWHQQIRKNSKTLRKGWATSLFSLVAFLIYAYLWLFPLLAVSFFKLWLAFIALKLILEFLTLTEAAKVFRRKFLIPYFPFFQIFYPFYISFFTILGLGQRYQWKK